MADFAVNLILKARDEATPVVRSLVGETKKLARRGRGGGDARNAGGPLGDDQWVKGFRQNGIQVANAMNRAGIGITNMANVGQRALYDIVGTGADFERSMSEVLAFGGDGFAPFMDRLKTEAKRLGETTEFKATDAANAMRQLTQAGLGPEEILSSLPAILDSAMAGAINLSEGAQIVAASMAQFKKEGVDAKRVSDLLATGTNLTQSNFAQFGKALQYVGGTAANMNIPIKDTVLLLAAQGKQALNNSRAGTSLNAMLEKFGTVASKGDNAMKTLLKRTGTSKKAFKELLDQGKVVDAFRLLNSNLEKSGLTATESGELLNKALGIRGKRAFQSIASQMSGTKPAFDDLERGLENVEGNGNKMAKVMGNNMTGSIRQWESAMEAAKITIAEELIPALRPLLQDATEGIKKFSKWVTVNKDAIRTWGPLVVKAILFGKVLGPVLTGMSGLIRFTTDVTPLLLKFAQKTGLAALATKDLAKAGGLAKVGAAGAAVGAFTAGYAFGEWADETFGLSDKLAGLNTLTQEQIDLQMALTKVRGGVAFLGDLTDDERKQMDAAKKKQEELFAEREGKSGIEDTFMAISDWTIPGFDPEEMGYRSSDKIEQEIAEQQAIIDSINQKGVKRGKANRASEAAANAAAGSIGNIGSATASTINEETVNRLIAAMEGQVNKEMGAELAVHVEVDDKRAAAKIQKVSGDGFGKGVRTGIPTEGL